MYTFNPEYTLNYSSLSEAVYIQRQITNGSDLYVYRNEHSLHIIFYNNTKEIVLNGLNYLFNLGMPSSFSFDIHLKNIMPHVADEAINYSKEVKLDIEKTDRNTLKITGHNQYMDALKVFDILYA